MPSFPLIMMQICSLSVPAVNERDFNYIAPYLCVTPAPLAMIYSRVTHRYFGTRLYNQHKN